jgi:hypothetical protein
MQPEVIADLLVAIGARRVCGGDGGVAMRVRALDRIEAWRGRSTLGTRHRNALGDGAGLQAARDEVLVTEKHLRAQLIPDRVGANAVGHESDVAAHGLGTR